MPDNNTDILLEHWTIEGTHQQLGAAFKYNKELKGDENVPFEAYSELIGMFNLCRDSSTLTFHRTLLTPPNTKPENRRYKIVGFVLSDQVEIRAIPNNKA